MRLPGRHHLELCWVESRDVPHGVDSGTVEGACDGLVHSVIVVVKPVA